MPLPASFSSDPEEVIRQHLRSLPSRVPLCVPKVETLHLLKARRRPQLRLYDVSFQDTTGHPWVMRLLLGRHLGDSWMVISAQYGGGNRPQEGIQARAHGDRPRLWLSAGGINAKQSSAPALAKARIDLWHLLNRLSAQPGGQEEARALLRAFEERIGTVPQQDREKAAWQMLQEVQQIVPPQQEAEDQWNPYYYFYAYGDVVDPSGVVVRVRLLSLDGTVLEDSVEDGLVLFWSNEYPERPLQAELYTRTGEVVGSQTVF